VPAVADRADPGDFAAPLDRAGWERVDQELPQVSAEHFRAATGAVVGFVEQDTALRVEHPRGFGAPVDEAAEPVEQACGVQGALPVVLVDVELAALGASTC
jgi:hypothetical protein